MSTANGSPSPGGIVATPDRDHAADSDDSLARKRQRLSETPEVRIEADEPEDMGDDLHNVIMIEDDPEGDLYSCSFQAIPGRHDLGEIGELKKLQHLVAGDLFFDPTILENVTNWIHQHLDDTAHDRTRWQAKYLKDQRFFTELAVFAHCVLDCSDLFDPTVSTQTIQRLVPSLYNALTSLCLRIISFIPKILEEPLTRRDSVQPAVAGQGLPLSIYISLLCKILSNHTPFSILAYRQFGVKASANIIRNTKLVLQQKSSIVALNKIFLGLSVQPRSFTDAWTIIADTIGILTIAFRFADAAYHATDGWEQVDAMFMAINEYVVPAICQKHPRALPPNFHDALILHTSAALEISVIHRPMSSILDIYHAITQVENALPCGLVEEPATELNLNEACGGDRKVLAELLKDLWLLQVLKGYVSTDILDIKSKGILSLRALLKESYNKHHKTGGDEHVVLQYLARFLRIGNFTEYIFSADSHASLVKECSDVVGFLAAIGTYTDHETDLIWQACTTSVEAEFVKASFEVLRSILMYVRPPQVLHMARKYSQTPASALGSLAVLFLSDALVKFHTANTNTDLLLEPMRISFGIVQRQDLDPPAATSQSLRNAAMHDIALLTGEAYGIDERKILYEMCLTEIKDRTKHATSCMEIMFLFLRHPGPEEAELILDLFPVRFAVQELEHFVSDSSKDETFGVHSKLDAVKIHLELVLYLVGLCELTEDKELEEQLWSSTIGDAAVSSQAREDALDCFIAIPQLTKNPSSVEQLFHRGVDQFLPTMSADCATMRLVAFLGGKVQEAESAAAPDDLEHILRDQSWQQLTRLANTTSSDSVAAAGIAAITHILFPKHGLRDDRHITARQAAFVRSHIDFLQTLQEEQNLALRQVATDRGITLLETVYQQSKALKPQIIGDAQHINLANTEEADRIEFTVHIHGPQSSPIARAVIARGDCYVADLGKALQSTSGVVDHDLVLNGSLSRIEDVSGQTLHEASIKSGSVVSIRPRYTFNCDFGKVFASTSLVEGEIRANFHHLESLLDGPDVVAERVYNFLSEVSPPMSTRQPVLSPEVTLEEIFPDARPWRTLYSIHVLSIHLRECNKLGVADQTFILHGARVLSDLLLDRSRSLSTNILSKCLPSLVGFMQERPQDSPPPPYIEDPRKLGLRLFAIIEQLERMTLITPASPTPQPGSLSVRAELTKLSYSVILQLARTDNLWPEIYNSDIFVGTHKGLLLSQDMSVSQIMSNMMADFMKEKPELATRSYLETLMALLPDAMSCRCSTTGFFALFREALMVDRRTSEHDESIRLTIQHLVQHMWQYRHAETAENAVVDSTFLNLLGLLNCAIDVLKSFKQPLALGSLAIDICNRLLFCDNVQALHADSMTNNVDDAPKASLTLRTSVNRTDDAAGMPETSSATLGQTTTGREQPSPLYHMHSRAMCTDIVRKLCDNPDAFAWLIDQATRVTQQAACCPVGAFPSGNYIRAPEASPGLPNLGMTCYMNSLLQQIYSNVQFRKYVFDTPLSNPSEHDLLWHVKRLFVEMQDSNLPCVDTQPLARYLNISVDTQEDVHGFYTIFMSALEQCLPDASTTAAFNSMFSGKLVTQVQGSCGHVSSRTEPFSDLSITVQNKTSLADSLDEFVQGEPMQGANKYKCLSCDAESGGKLVDAMRRTCLDAVPDHLTVCLKRFTFDMMGQESKNNDLFRFPEEIDLSAYKRESLESTGSAATPDLFSLVGVIVHSGILTFGHYWSYVRLRYPDHHISRWARLEDSNFRPAKGFEEVQNECFGGENRTHNGYVLFYQRNSSFENGTSAMPKDAQMGHSLPPRVQPPSDIFQEICQQNIVRHRTAQPFDDSFHRLVTEIMHDFRRHAPSAVEASGSPQSPGTTLTDDNQLDASDKLGLHASLARLALSYTSRILLGEKVPQKLLHFVMGFKTLATTDALLARSFIAEVLNDPEVLLRVIDHDDTDSRNVLKALLRDCFTLLRDQDPFDYLGLLVQFVTAHASLLSQMGPRFYKWYDYFSLAFDLKMLGDNENGMILNADYIPWILEVALEVPCNPSAFTDQRILWNAHRKGKVSYAPLIHFVQLTLQQDHAFDARDSFDEFTNHGRYRAAQGLVRLTNATGLSRLNWMWVTSLADTDAMAWEQYPPAMLVNNMASSPDLRYRGILARSLSACFQNDYLFKPALYHMTTAFICACGDDNAGLSRRALGFMIEGIKQFERMPCKAGLDVLSAVMSAAPLSVLRSVESWAPDWLMPDNRCPKRTLGWLRERIFGITMLDTVLEGSEIWGTAVDVARSRAVRLLVEACSEILLRAHEIEEGCAYPQMVAALHDAYEFLDMLLRRCNGVQLQAQGIRDHDEAIADLLETGGDELSDAEVPSLSTGMIEECRAATQVRHRLGRLLQQMRAWDDEQEPIAEGEDSSIYYDTDADYDE